MPYVDRPIPSSGLEGKFSLQYTACAALLDGAVGIATFTDERLASPDMRLLLPKARLIMSADIPAHFEGMHVILSVEMVDGSRLSSRCDGPPGSWSRPPISEADHLRKVRDCLAVRLNPEAAEACIALAGQLDELDEDGVRRLAAIARGSMDAAEGGSG